MKKSQLKKLIREELDSLNLSKYQVVFYDDYGYEDVPYTEELFNSEKEAYKWVEDMKWSEQDIRINDEGNDEFYTRYQYHNPEDHYNYSGYKIVKLK